MISMMKEFKSKTHPSNTIPCIFELFEMQGYIIDTSWQGDTAPNYSFGPQEHGIYDYTVWIAPVGESKRFKIDNRNKIFGLELFTDDLQEVLDKIKELSE